MECPKCGYVMDAFASDCPRCKHFEKVGKELPTYRTDHSPYIISLVDIHSESSVGKICPLCQIPIESGHTIIECSTCKIPHHEFCWRENGGCTTLGCIDHQQNISDQNLTTDIANPVLQQSSLPPIVSIFERNKVIILLLLVLPISYLIIGYFVLGRPGIVKGIVTYRYNDYIGHKPDVGARIWLIKSDIDIPEEAEFLDLTNETNDIVVTIGDDDIFYQIFYNTAVDGNGNFTLSDVRPGEYTLVIQSKYSLGSDGKRTQRDCDGTVHCQQINVSSGDIVDGSYDFGYTSYFENE